MSESINNYNINNSYTYNNSELQKYDTDEDGNLSLFEIENIEDEQDYQLLLEDIENQNTSEEEDIETQISNLESLLDNAENSQGIIGKAWNGIKNVTGIGLSIKKCEQAIDDFKNGKITYDEAYTKISKFSQKQENSVDFVSNMVSGTAAALVVGSAILTGGLSLGIVAGAAAIGAATKAGLKFADRATNKVKGDALDAKQIAKDSLSGAVNGAVSVATMGIGSTAAVTGETIASQTLKQTIIQGAKAGAAEGAVSGAVIGASDYTIDAVFEDDVDFNIEDLAKSTATNAAGGAIFGGIIGGVTSGVQYSKVSSSLKNDTTADVDLPNASEASNNSQLPDSTETKLPSVASSKQDTGEIQIPDEIAAELKKQAEDLNGEFKANINEATGQIEKEFGSLSSVEEKGITGRAKGEDSILAKLEKKFENQKLTDTSKEACTDAIGDAYGTRVQLKSLSTERSKEIIEDCLSGSDITYEQFIQYMNGDTLNLDDAGISALSEMKSTIIDLLKEEQTQEAVDRLVDAISSGRLTITELNNYGDDISSYFTNTQLQQIADAYYNKTGTSLTLVTADDFTEGSGTKIDLTGSSDYTANIDTSKALKDSGYATSQMNLKQSLNNDTIIGNGELQIRGSALNEFADAEHIPYDIKSGKITDADTKYSDIFGIITEMEDNGTYDIYNQYIVDTYKHLRLKELGIETVKPDITKYVSELNLPDGATDLLSMEGLIKISKRKN